MKRANTCRTTLITTTLKHGTPVARTVSTWLERYFLEGFGEQLAFAAEQARGGIFAYNFPGALTGTAR